MGAGPAHADLIATTGARPSSRGGRFAAAGIRGWDLWALDPVARAYVLGVIAAAATMAGLTCAQTAWPGPALLRAGVLLACAIAAIEGTRGVRQAHSAVNSDLGSVWMLAAAVTLPPAFTFVLAFTIAGYKIVRVHPQPRRYRPVVSGAAVGLAYAAASGVFHAIPASVAGASFGAGRHALTWPASVVVCGTLAASANHLLLAVAVRRADPSARLGLFAWRREAAVPGALELSLATIVALLAAISPWLPILALPGVVLCKRSLMLGRMSAPSRLDAVSGALNAETWNREAEALFLRACRSQTPLAVAILQLNDLDAVGQSAGRAVRDELVHAVAAILASELSASDLLGRADADTFVVLLPHAAADGARRICEQLRDRISAEAVTAAAGDQSGWYVLRLTTSIGAAAMENAQPPVLGDLVAAAAAALDVARRPDGASKVHATAYCRP